MELFSLSVKVRRQLVGSSKGAYTILVVVQVAYHEPCNVGENVKY